MKNKKTIKSKNIEKLKKFLIKLKICKKINQKIDMP